MLNQKKQTGDAHEPDMALCQPRWSHMFLLVVLHWLNWIILMLIRCYYHIFHPQLLTWLRGDRHKRLSLSQKKACFIDTCSSFCWLLLICFGFVFRVVTFQLHISRLAPGDDEQQMWAGTLFLMSSHVHPKNMQLSSPRSAPRYHNYMCGSSHRNNLAQTGEVSMLQVMTKKWYNR